MTRLEIVDSEIFFHRERVKDLRRILHSVQREIDRCETRIDDLRRERDKTEDN